MSFVRVVNKRAAYLLATVASAGAVSASVGSSNNDNNNPRFNSDRWWKGFKGAGLAAAAPALHVAQVEKGKTPQDFQNVYNAIAKKLINDDEYDNYIGYGPVLVRLSWHASGTFDKRDNSGGSYGGTYRFPKETNDPSNKGLQNAKAFLEPIYQQFPWISHGDLYTLAGVTALQEMQGPKVPWRPGRVDLPESATPDNGRLPDAEYGPDYVRNFYKRFDFNDQEVVALLGAHALGKTHLANSGYEGPWGAATNTFSNEFFVNLLNEQWKPVKTEAGNIQYDSPSGFMMMPTDMALKEDGNYLKYVKKYAQDQNAFFEDFKNAYQKLLEKGITFPAGTPTIVFKTLDEQGL